MNTSCTPGQQAVAGSVNLATYRKQLAEAATRFDREPALAARRAESDVVEVSSLQSEGYSKKGYLSALPRLQDTAGELDAEARAVLQSIAAGVEERFGSAEGFFFQPVSASGSMLFGRASRNAPDSGDLHIVQVALHDTPSLPGGLMLLSPLQDQDRTAALESTLLQRSTRAGVKLDHIQQGWTLLQ